MAKKKIISAILMSTVILSAAAPLSGVYAGEPPPGKPADDAGLV
nr:Usp-BPC-157 [synthetic construct]